MSLEVTNIGQQLTAMDRHPENSVNTSLRSTITTLQNEKKENQAETSALNEEKLLQVVDQIQNISNMFDRKLQFKVSKELNQVIVKVIDSNTETVIREIPSAEIQKLQIRIKDALGLLFDESI